MHEHYVVLTFDSSGVTRLAFEKASTDCMYSQTIGSKNHHPEPRVPDGPILQRNLKFEVFFSV